MRMFRVALVVVAAVVLPRVAVAQARVEILKIGSLTWR